MRSYGVYLAHENRRCVEIKGYKAAFDEQLFKGMNISNVKNSNCFVVLLISTFLLLTACEPAKDLHDRDKKNPDLQAQQISINKLKLTEKDHTEIEAVYGWLNSNTVLYSKKLKGEERSELMTWNLESNEHQVFYQPSAPISSVSISPTKSYVLVTTTLDEKIQSTILNANGNPVYIVSLPAYEITYEWNVYQDGVLFISNFFEDWSYNSYLVNVEKQTTKMINQPEPFAQWDSKNGMIFLDWPKGESTLTAPLVKKELNEEKLDSIMLDVVHFKKMKHILMTLQVETEKSDRMTYAFFNEKYKPITTFSVPHINSSYSDWLIPAYDLNEQKGDLFTFVPEKSANTNRNDGGFTLIKFNWKSNKKEKILENIDNEPLSCSPNASLCLYGYQFDKIIDVKNHRIKQMFKPSLH